MTEKSNRIGRPTLSLFIHLNILIDWRSGYPKGKILSTWFHDRKTIGQTRYVLFQITLKILQNKLRTPNIYSDQLNMALLFWYLDKSDLFNVHVYSGVQLKSHFIQGTRKTRPSLTGHPVNEYLSQATDGDEELRSLITLSKTNLVVSSLMAKGAGDRALNFDFSLHKSFPLFKLT